MKKVNVNAFKLTKELKKYQPADETEKDYLKLLKEFLGGDNTKDKAENEKDKSGKIKKLKDKNLNENLFLRTNTAGHVTGSAFLLNKDLTKVLLTHHKALNKWLQFGGHSDGDKNTLNVAWRETNEESGIDLSDIKPISSSIFDIDVHKIPANPKRNEGEHLHYDVRFVFTTDKEDFKISDESNDLKWATLEEFKKLKETDPLNKLSSARFVKKWEELQKSKK
jgi:8-oxo-dGTP pyrophosphatase MutT (NUDIX family)